MNIEIFSHAKYKQSGRTGDDVLLVIPDRVLAVFDGATDPTGATYDGESAGRFAARAAARTIAELALCGKLAALPAGAVFQAMSDAVKAEAERRNAGHPPSTTAAVVYDAGGHYRFLLAGDTGVRINGTTVHQHHKLVDTVSTAARIAVFKRLASRIGSPDEAEMATRSVIFSGLQNAVTHGILSREEAEEAVTSAITAAGLQEAPEVVREFLGGGLRVQPRFANRAGHVLGFASLNGSAVIPDGTMDFSLPKSDIQSIEIFSDGYLTQPGGTRVADWEAEFARVENGDLHKTGAHPAVKGSTSKEFCDDRTVICLTATP
jgi:hypothetical protein